MRGNDFVHKMEQLIWGKERRRRQRYSVSWDGHLGVHFPDHEAEVAVRVVDFSGCGARVYSSQVLIHQRYLTSVDYPPGLILKIVLPEGIVECRSAVRWYRWSVQDSVYEIAVEFMEMMKESEHLIHTVINRLRSQKERRVI